MPPDAPDISQTQDEVLEVLKSAKEWFGRQDNQKLIREQALETAEWLAGNEFRYDANGLKKKEPWWPRLPRTDDETIIQIRRLGLIDKVCEHGWHHMLDGLIDKGVIADLAESSEQIVDLLALRARSLIHELVLDALTDGEEKALGDVAKRFGIGLAKFRNRWLVRLASIGVLIGRYNNGYGIKVGPVAYKFVCMVFTPTVAKFEPETKGVY